MSIFDEEGRKIIRSHEVGQDLSMLSVEELNARIVQLQEEIRRIEQELAAKGSTKAAAEALFKRG